MMYLNSNQRGATALNEVQNIAVGATVTLADFQAKADVSLMQLAFAVSDPTLWGTGSGLSLKIAVDGTVFMVMTSEFSDLKRPASFFINLKEKQYIKVELTNSTGLIIADCAIKLDLVV